MKLVNTSVKKIDSRALTTGKPVYTDDIAPKECLIVKLLRSPHAHALVEEMDTTIAEKVPGVECVLTYKDVPHIRFTNAGQTFPEPSPYDRLIVENKMRYVGDVAAIVAADTEEAANKAISLIKVKYTPLPAILDFEESLTSDILIHDEENYHLNFDIGNDVAHNKCSSECFEFGDVEEALSKSDVTVDEVYYIQAQSQCMMETFRTYTYLDYNNRLTIVSSTQIPFHVRRILARALEIPKTRIRVVKPRIGGGFGAKQTAVSEFYPAIVTMKTGKPAKIVFDRYESFFASNSRHQMRIRVRAGANKDGKIQAIDVTTLSNTGAYGEHGCTTVGLSGYKTLPLYNRTTASRFKADVVYTNQMPAAAFRGYGATQGCFAVESAINELAIKLNINPITLREKNIVQVGETMHAYHNEVLRSSTLDQCIETGKKLIGWDDKYPRKDLGNGKVRGVGMAITMQGSGIAGIDTASAEVRLNDDGFYSLLIGATDMGTGCDTILAQMAADCLSCGMDRMIVSGVDTDHSPFDTGSYASSTTYVTGMAVVKASEQLVEKIKEEGAKKLEVSMDQVDFDGDQVYVPDSDLSISLNNLAQSLVIGSGNCLKGFATHGSPVSPPPFVAGFAEVEVDTYTGHTKVINMIGVVDCGTVINKALSTLQTEGGLAQGIGLALLEDVRYDKDGRMMSDSFMQYKIPARTDVGKIQVAFEESYEPTGPFGAKSIGEVVLNTPAPAIADAIYNAVGVRMRSLPMTPEKIFTALQEKKNEQKQK